MLPCLSGLFSLGLPSPFRRRSDATARTLHCTAASLSTAVASGVHMPLHGQSQSLPEAFGCHCTHCIAHYTHCISHCTHCIAHYTHCSPGGSEWITSVGDYVDNSFTALGSSDPWEVRLELWLAFMFCFSLTKFHCIFFHV